MRPLTPPEYAAPRHAEVVPSYGIEMRRDYRYGTSCVGLRPKVDDARVNRPADRGRSLAASRLIGLDPTYDVKTDI